MLQTPTRPSRRCSSLRPMLASIAGGMLSETRGAWNWLRNEVAVPVGDRRRTHRRSACVLMVGASVADLAVEAPDPAQGGHVPAEGVAHGLEVRVVQRAELALEVDERPPAGGRAALPHQAGEDRVVAAGKALANVADEVRDRLREDG